MKVTLRLVDVVTALLAVLAVALLAVWVDVGAGDGFLRMLAVLTSAAAMVATAAGWLAKKIDALREDCFAEGMRVGMAAQRVIPLPRDHDRV